MLKHTYLEIRTLIKEISRHPLFPTAHKQFPETSGFIQEVNETTSTVFALIEDADTYGYDVTPNMVPRLLNDGQEALVDLRKMIIVMDEFLPPKNSKLFN